MSLRKTYQVPESLQARLDKVELDEKIVAAKAA